MLEVRCFKVMNSARLNHRIKFSQITITQNDSGGAVSTLVPVAVSEINPTDVTWGELKPVSARNQLALDAGASVLNGDKILMIRKRAMFTPEKDMLFEDLNTPGDVYTIHAILPYYENEYKQQPYRDSEYITILGTKRN